MFKATQGSFLAETRETAAQVNFGAYCGRAATAWEDRSPGLPQRALKKILALLRKSDKPENRLARETRRVDRILAETRANGFGTRDPSFIGGAYEAAVQRAPAT